MHPDAKKTLSWMVCAMLVMGLAIWQAQVAVIRGQRTHDASLPAPAKTRQAVRPPPKSHGGDPILNYQARKEKGLTDREIRWIVDDFKAAGLDLGIRQAVPEDYVAQRRVQDRWYRDALIEGWSLDREQAGQVTAKLSELSELAIADFMQALKTGPRPVQVGGQLYTLIGAGTIHQLVDFSNRIADGNSKSLPWNLCKLPADDFQKSSTASMPDLVEHLLPRPKSTAPPTEPKTHELPELPNLSALHPAQLKLMLLLSPKIVGEIENLLNQPNP